MRSSLSTLSRPVLLLIAAARLVLIAAAMLVAVPVFAGARLFGGSRNAARVLRRFLQWCGGGFVKLGQLLSTRYDLISPIYCAELAGLLDAADAVDAAKITAVIEEDLGGELAVLFADFDRQPLASASIAQVHAATLHSGAEVVVKVRRPRAAVVFRVDFQLLRLASRVMDLALGFGRPRFRGLVLEIEDSILEELDFKREARNCHRMRQLMQTDPVRHDAPKVYFSYSSPRVLTMERVRGVPVKDIITALDEGDDDQLAVWAEHGITPERIARRLLVSVLTQTMRHRFFHSDPHPANIIVRTDGTLSWVDFGMTGWMDDRTWIQQFRLRDAIARKDLHRAYEALLDTLEPIPPVDLRAFENAVEAAMQDWVIASESPGASLVEKSSGFFLMRTFDAIRRAGLHMPARLMRLYRTMMIADMVMLKLHPRINWVPILRRFVEVETRRQVRDSSSPLFPSFVEGLQAVLRIPSASIRLIDWLNSRLPRYGRMYERQLSVFEAAALAGVHFLRGIAGLVAIGTAALLAGVAASTVPAILQPFESFFLPTAIGAVVVFVWASLVLRLLPK